MRAFGVFEGGGLRGYAHIGALRAIEKRGIEFEQVAGTSIGAVVAALVAAGYQADDIYRDGEGGASGTAVVNFEGMFERRDWNTILRLGRDLRRIERFGRFFAGFGFSSPFKIKHPMAAASIVWLFMPFLWIAAPFLYFRYRRVHSSLWRLWGMVDAAKLRSWLDTCLRQRLGHVPADREVRFEDLKTPLRVIVADVQAGVLKVVGEDPCAPVVDAVIASASVPFFFRPQRSGNAVFVDGGLLSNVPAWVFDHQRAALPRTMATITLRLVPGATVQQLVETSTIARFVPRLMATALDGARSLELRRIDDHHVIGLEADIGILDFDKIKEEQARLVKSGEECAERYFRENLGPFDPAEAGRVLKAIAAFIKEALRISGYVRAYAILPLDQEFLRVASSANMEEDADDQLLIRRCSMGPAAAFLYKEPVIVTMSRISEEVRRNPLFKYEYAARPKGLATICAVPFFADPRDWVRPPAERGSPMGLLAFDAEESIRTKLVDVDAEDLIASYAQFVGERLRRREVHEFDPGVVGAKDGGRLIEIAPGVELYERKERSLRMDIELARLQSELSATAA